MGPDKLGPVVGVFETQEQVEQAYDRLRRVGFTDQQIGIVARDTKVVQEITGRDESGSDMARGAGIGLLAGACLGGFAVGATAIPVAGPVIATGIFAGILSGALAGGLIGALIGLGVPEEHARHYEQHVREGRILLTVQTDQRRDEAAAILRSCGGATTESPALVP